MRTRPNFANTPIALTLLAFAATAASAQQTAYDAAPVLVRSCSLAEGDIVTPYPSSVRLSNGINVSFANTSRAKIARVTFEASYNGRTETIDDAGTLAPNASVDRDLHAFTGMVVSGGSLACSVVKVEFADGTSWRSPAANVASR